MEDELLVVPSSWRDKKLARRFHHYASSLFNVEISLFLYFVAVGMVVPAQQNFVYQRMCMIKYQSVRICANIDTMASLSHQEDTIQEEYSYYNTVMTLMQNIPISVVTIYMGIICDRVSYRVPLAAPQVGLALSTGLYLLFSYMPISATPAIVLCLPSLLIGMSGGITTEIVAGLAYVTKTTSSENRTFRIAAVEASLTLGAAAGFFLSGLVLSFSTNELVFLVQIALSCYSVAYIFSVLPELHSLDEIRQRIKTEARGSRLRYFLLPGALASRLSLFRLDPDTAQSAAMYFGKNKRMVALILYASLLSTGVIFGVGSITYEFLTSEPISLPANMYAIFQGVYCLLNAVNMVITVRVLRKLSFSDSALSMIGAISRTAALLVLSFGDYYPSYAPWLNCVVYMGSGFFSVGLRALLSRVVSADIRGAMFALMGVLENVTNVLLTFVFNYFYSTLITSAGTDKAVPPMIHGLVFLLAACLNLPAILVNVWLLKKEKELIPPQPQVSSTDATS